jgi:hypothetical protein
VRRGLRALAQTAAGVALGAHMLAIVLATLPTTGPHAELRRLAQRHLGLDAYLDASGQRQSWAMFAPDPYRANVFVAVAVEAGDGVVHPLDHDVYAAIVGQARTPYLRYDRLQKLNRALAEAAGTRRDYAAWVCRQWELDHGGVPARAVHFTLRRTFVPPPEVVDARARAHGLAAWGYMPAALRVHTHVWPAIPCATTPAAQLPPAIRARHGLPPRPAEAPYVAPRMITWRDEQRLADELAERARTASTREDEGEDEAGP